MRWGLGEKGEGKKRVREGGEMGIRVKRGGERFENSVKKNEKGGNLVAGRP